MKNKSIILTSFIILFCLSEQIIKAQDIANKKKEIITIDINKIYPEKDITIQDIASVEYIPLETNNNSLLKYLNIGSITDSLIITYNLDGDVFVFNRKGKFINTFNRKGGAGHEYSNLHFLCFDNKKNEVYIEDHGVQCKIYVYSLNGIFKRKFNLPENIWPYLMQNYDNDYLLCCDGYELDKPNVKTKETPYFFISKKNNEITPLNYKISKKIKNYITETRGNQSIASAINASPLIKNGNETLLSDFASDTIYSLKGNSRTPFIVKKPFIQNNNPSVLFYIKLFSDKYLIMSSIKRQFKAENPEIKLFGYDRVKNKIYKLNFLNTDWVFKTDTNIDNIPDLPNNYAQRQLSAETLIEGLEKGQLKGKLKEVASKLKLDDNPVIMLIKFNK